MCKPQLILSEKMECFHDSELKKLLKSSSLLTLNKKLPNIFGNSLIGKNLIKLVLFTHTLIVFSLSLDALLHYYWCNVKHQFQTYDELVECIKLTPREWNKNIHQEELLRNISWMLNYDINIIGFKRTAFLNETDCCETHGSMCRYSYYIFKNPILSYKKKDSNIANVSIVIYAKQMYLFIHSKLKPLLINKFPEVIDCISNEKIVSIIQNKEIEHSVNVNIYSSYHYIRSNYVKSIGKLLIGQYYNKNNTNTLHLFFSPHPVCPGFYLNLLHNMSNISLKGLGAQKNITEGTKIFQQKKLQSELEGKSIDNQEHCVCDHPSTSQLMLLPAYKSFKPLGNKIYII